MATQRDKSTGSDGPAELQASASGDRASVPTRDDNGCADGLRYRHSELARELKGDARHVYAAAVYLYGWTDESMTRDDFAQCVESAGKFPGVPLYRPSEVYQWQFQHRISRSLTQGSE